MEIYAIFDSKAEAYLRPFFCPNNAVAIRSFSAAAQQEGSDFNKHAADYTLFHIGSFDEYHATLKDHTNTPLGTAIEYLANTAQVDQLHLVEEN